MSTVFSSASATPAPNICAPASWGQKWRHMHFNIYQEYSHKRKSTFHHIRPLCDSIQDLDGDIYVISSLLLPLGWQRFKEILWGVPCKVGLLTCEWHWWKKAEMVFWAWIGLSPCGLYQIIFFINHSKNIDINIYSYRYTKHSTCVIDCSVVCDLNPCLWGLSQCARDSSDGEENPWDKGNTRWYFTSDFKWLQEIIPHG